MSYTSINQCAHDQEFLARIQACAAQEGHDNPEYATDVLLRWPVASYPEIAEAYEYAVGSHNPNPGKDPGVISDAQILAVVQPILKPPPPRCHEPVVQPDAVTGLPGVDGRPVPSR